MRASAYGSYFLSAVLILVAVVTLFHSVIGVLPLDLAEIILLWSLFVVGVNEIILASMALKNSGEVSPRCPP